jgi:hypothetical protein
MKRSEWLPATIVFLVISQLTGCAGPKDVEQTLKPGVPGSDWSLVAKSRPATKWYWLFDGKTLNSWANHTGDAQWLVKDGAITATAATRPSFLATTAEYEDFAVTVDVFAEPGHSAGMVVRGTRTSKSDAVPGAISGYEIHMGSDDEGTNGPGSIEGLASSTPGASVAGGWHTYEIEAAGSHIIVRMDQKITADIQDSIHTKGMIALRSAGTGSVQYRNIKFRDK